MVPPLWAASASESASYLVEAAFGSYSSGMITEWVHLMIMRGWVASSVPDQPNARSDGSLVLDRVTGISSSGAGFFAHQSVIFWEDRRWGHVDHVRPAGDFQSRRGFCSVLGPLQSVQRAEMCGVIWALQSSGAVHLGVDNLGVVRHFGRLLDGHSWFLFRLNSSKMAIFSCFLKECFVLEGLTRCGSLRLS